ncbi:type IV secretory system conjugative DNA transfer family protein [Fibrisoma limi]|uniref:type IV secretory system conjugative DNA transfer family protein n=1 Tax=Fibrisoma limi TaxID=663275 RepID=UPI000686259D|nr:type IV secretion system DNA-binding domain-containing protein [Fibrisoma limi]
MKQFDLDNIIYGFNDRHPLTIRDACEGVQIFGGIGSGKTSGSGAALARAFLKSGFGGLVLCAKKDELATWQRYARETGRDDSLLVFDGSGKYCFPFLEYEINREGEGAGLTENLVRLFMTVHEAISRRSGNGGDPYWQTAMQQLMRNAIDLSMIARGTVSVPLMHDIVRTAPQSREECESEEWRKVSICWQLLMECHAKELDHWTQCDFDTTAGFWLEEFPAISAKTRSGIVSMFTTTTDNFMRKPFRMLFSESPTDPANIAYPELSHHGAVIVMHLPVKEYGDAGRAAQIVYKYIWQQAAERRDVHENPRPIFLWVDEAQNFATDYDMQFQATARSSRACTVYLTQNLPNYFAEIGNHDRVHSLVGNLQTKIFHANSDPETNNYAAEVIGKSWHVRQGESHSFGDSSFNVGRSGQESFDYDVPPQTFTRLPKGGQKNGNTVGGIVFQNGRAWSENETFLYATFKQS